MTQTIEKAGYELFRTAIGVCGIAWEGGAVIAVKLPERTDSLTEQELSRMAPDAGRCEPPPFAREAIRRIVHHLAGNPQDLSGIPLRLESVPSFHRKVYGALRKVPSGETVTYGDLARRVGSPGAARAVGQAMRGNPFAILVPCHRVVAADGRLGGFSAYGRGATKERMLEIEGVRLASAAPLLPDLETAEVRIR